MQERRVRAIVLLSALALACWLGLCALYPLATYYAVPFFSIGKLDGRDVALTALLFIGLGVSYGGMALALRDLSALPRHVRFVLPLTVALSSALAVATYPFTAVDVYNYLAVLKLTFFYGQNPYLVPFLPTFAADPLASRALFLTSTTGYGPLWVLLAGLPLRLVGFELLPALLATKLLRLLWLLAGTALPAWSQPASQQRWLAAYLYAANPLVLFEGVVNAHNDVLLATLLVAALLALRRGWLLALPLLALSFLVKPFTLPLVLLFVRGLARAGRRLLGIVLALSLTVLVVRGAFIPFWSEGEVIFTVVRGVSEAQAVDSASLPSLLRTTLDEWHAAPGGVLAAQRTLLGIYIVLA
jgi:hypothetical protein